MFTYNSLVIVVLSKKCVDPPNLRTTPRLTKSLTAHTFQGVILVTFNTQAVIYYEMYLADKISQQR